MRAWISPRRMSRLTPSRARVPGNVLAMPRTRRTRSRSLEGDASTGCCWCFLEDAPCLLVSRAEVLRRFVALSGCGEVVLAIDEPVPDPGVLRLLTVEDAVERVDGGVARPHGRERIGRVLTAVVPDELDVGGEALARDDRELIVSTRLHDGVPDAEEHGRVVRDVDRVGLGVLE